VRNVVGGVRRPVSGSAPEAVRRRGSPAGQLDMSQPHRAVKIAVDAIRWRVDGAVSFFYVCPLASIAARTFGGDIGSSVSRVPTARSIALAIAAIGGQMLTSAAPLAPYG
jgi:hypothetical protein